jgi:hypothetical protein
VSFIENRNIHEYQENTFERKGILKKYNDFEDHSSQRKAFIREIEKKIKSWKDSFLELPGLKKRIRENYLVLLDKDSALARAGIRAYCKFRKKSVTMASKLIIALP